MWILGIETSGLASSVVLQQDNEICGEISLCRSARQETNRLIPAVQQLMKKAQRRPEQLDLLAVTVGPGSFTGLRIGLTYAKTFGYVTGCPLVGVETFSALTEKISSEHARLEVVEDLRQGYVAWQTFHWDNGESQSGWVPADKIRVELFTQWQLREPDRGVLTGGGLTRLQQQFPEKSFPIEWTQLSAEFYYPTAREVIAAGLKKWRSFGATSPFALLPVYLRRSAAEEKREHETAAGLNSVGTLAEDN